jgi:hypothetical protein
MLQEYDVVRLASRSDGIPVAVGTRGTVLMIFQDTSPAYMVEFMNAAGKSLGTFAVPEKNLIPEPSTKKDKSEQQ